MSLTVHRLFSVKDALKKLKKLNQFQFLLISNLYSYSGILCFQIFLYILERSSFDYEQ